MACLLTWAAMQAYIIHSFGFNWYMAIVDSVINTILLTAACWLINNNLRYYQPGTKGYINLVVWCGVLSGLCITAARWLLPALIADKIYKDFLLQSLIIRFFIGFLAVGCMAMVSVIFYSQLDQKKSDKRKADAERLAREAELYNLRQQLQPHFLFNSLNSINALIGIRPEEARKMIHQLSDFLRGTLKKDDQEPVTLAEELAHLQLYLDIEKVRFGHRLITEISCDSKSGTTLLPAMLLQPIVENSIKFGLYDTTEEVTISIRAEVSDNYLVLMVQNPYDAQTTRPRQGTGFGLSGVQRRLYLLFARNDLVETHAEDNLYTTIIKIPQLT
ncbi:putative signal transduction histidine kinase [Mucilaginibacter paludis DSM 18603]|uniref:Signal transduction histidine kinase n=1 Tax=Mucilaginibacter paludis DSM 18603 TaxID=714943 RepID=H1Y6Z5_9SPHI|nr:putative signal transduction histidine kinase [Mucilaginibacter paludis DSM 18603]